MQDWDNIRFFLAVASLGSVSSAADQLGVNQSTVSRRINNFEKKMDVRLFERLSTGYQLTPEGEELQQRAIRIRDEVLSIENSIMGKNIELEGPVRLTTSLAMLDYLLMPILKEFSEQYPGIEIQLDLSDNIFNLSQREADIALRVTPGMPPENLIGRELGKVKLAVYGEKHYLKKYYKSKKGCPLHWIGEDNKDLQPRWLYANTRPLKLVMRTNDVLATLTAIKNGLGVGRLPRLIGDATSELIRFEDTPVLPELSLWLLTHVDMRKINRMRVFNAFLAENIKNSLTEMSEGILKDSSSF